MPSSETTMSDRIRCASCDRLLITVEWGRVCTHGSLSICDHGPDEAAAVECPACGRETLIAAQQLGLRFRGHALRAAV